MQYETMAGADDEILARKIPGAPEAGVQMAIIRRVAFCGVVCIHVKNEGKQSVGGRMRAKKAGLLPGFPDLICLQAPGHVAFLEVKESSWKPPSDKAKGEKAQHFRRQLDAHAMLRRLGFAAEFVTSQDQAVAVLKTAGFRL